MKASEFQKLLKKIEQKVSLDDVEIDINGSTINFSSTTLSVDEFIKIDPEHLCDEDDGFVTLFIY